jgi:iron complex outermembrane receptor protein
VTYENGPWQLTLNQLFVGHYIDADEERTVGTYSLLNLNTAYSGIRNLTLTLGVRNVMDRDPPFTRQTQAFQVGYDPALSDPTGRFYYASIRYRFR